MSVEDTRMRDKLRALAGAELVERLDFLERRQQRRLPDAPLPVPAVDDRLDADVIFGGGGLSLLIAAELAGRGISVLVFERARAGTAHREWNASRSELQVLVDRGLVDEATLAGMIVASYKDGFCRFHGGKADHVVAGVLDQAIDAGALAAPVRAVAEARGVRFVDGVSVDGLGPGEYGVRVRAKRLGDIPLADQGKPGKDAVFAQGKLFVDARGASSPYATADLLCPTVGGVLRGLPEGDGPKRWRRDVGEILVTTEGIVDGVQHVWEGFPGRDGELTTYLFYYAKAAKLAGRPRLLALYTRFFETLPSYKDGDPTLVRPTFGYIPGWSRLTRPAAPPHPRVALVGDAAARQSPLTFCGFGAMLRSFVGAADALEKGLTTGRLPPSIVDDAEVHAGTGPLAALMADSGMQGDALNHLLDDAFGALADAGNETYASLLQDRMGREAFRAFVLQTAGRHPRVYADVFTSLGLVDALRWGAKVTTGLGWKS